MNAPVQYVDVHRVLCSGPGDMGGVQALVASGALRPADIVAVMGKTEGNGCVNDFTRDFATARWCDFLSQYLGCLPSEVGQRVALVMSGGTEGVLSPHFTFSRAAGWLPNCTTLASVWWWAWRIPAIFYRKRLAAVPRSSARPQP